MDEKIEKEFSAASVLVNTNKEGSDFGNTCCLCGNYDSQLMPLFNGDGISHNLYGKIIRHLTTIKISKSDNLPSKICYQCVSTLISWDDLFEACLEVDKRLRKVVQLLENKKNSKSTCSITTNGADSLLSGSISADGYNFENAEDMGFDIMNIDFSDIANLDDFNSDDFAVTNSYLDKNGADYNDGNRFEGNNENYCEPDYAGKMWVENETSPFLFQSFSGTTPTFLLNQQTTAALLPLQNSSFPLSSNLLSNNMNDVTNYPTLNDIIDAEGTVKIKSNSKMG